MRGHLEGAHLETDHCGALRTGADLGDTVCPIRRRRSSRVPWSLRKVARVSTICSTSGSSELWAMLGRCRPHLLASSAARWHFLLVKVCSMRRSASLTTTASLARRLTRVSDGIVLSLVSCRKGRSGWVVVQRLNLTQRIYYILRKLRADEES
jgi:hypothetical protein